MLDAVWGWAASAPAGKPESAGYARPFETPTRPALMALPPGAVRPEGWLRDWRLAARDGYTGHMDEVHEEFRRAWAEDHKMTGPRLNWPQGAWPYEGGGYWFDGLVRLGYLLHDQGLIEQAKRRLDVVVRRMNSNSIVFLWWLNKNNPEDAQAVTTDSGWPIWACGLLGRAMAAKWDWPLDSPLKLRVPAAPIQWEMDVRTPRLPAQPTTLANQKEQITLIPYGCAKFRISMFPAILPESTKK